MIVWLASGSPRRRQLLEDAGFAVEVHPPDVDETRRAGEDPVAYAVRLARTKAATGPADRVVVAADTVVWQGDVVLGKPASRTEAHATLRALSGGVHRVTTGTCVRRGAAVDAFAVTTEVRFRALTDAEIAAYLETGEADDKAGAYGIQGRAAGFVAEVHGSWTNVVGLPMEAVVPRLRAEVP